jgi:TPP-dependent 2-oxoacid decarboxylase
MQGSATTTIGNYIIQRLYELGVRHMFGVPGDYVLDFLDEVVKSPIKWIGNCNELNAGYAADGYARTTGLGAVAVTHGVGGFSLLNAVAGAYAEQIPLVVINGAPSSAHRNADLMVHHLSGDYLVQYEIFRKLTVDAVLLTDAQSAPDEIDRILVGCITHKRPVYLEIPRDMVALPCRAPGPLRFPEKKSDPEILEECVEEAAALINASRHPVLLAGVELVRFGLAEAVLRLIERIEIPFVMTASSKSALPELHPQFIGIYQGALSRDSVRREIESSDCVLSLGFWETDWDTGGFSVNFDQRRMISANDGQVRIKRHIFPNVVMGDFIAGLSRALTPRSFMSSHPSTPLRLKEPYHPQPEAALRSARFFERLNSFLDDGMILLAEPGDAGCAATDMLVEEAGNFIVQDYYLSIGYCLPASLGISLGRPDKRPVVLTGDGAFQMTVQELSTLLRHGCRPVIFLLNNEGYLVERLLHKDGPYNDIQNWKYHRLPSVFGADFLSFEVRTEGDLEEAMSAALRERDKLIFVELRLASHDCSDGLARMAERFRALGG